MKIDNKQNNEKPQSKAGQIDTTIVELKEVVDELSMFAGNLEKRNTFFDWLVRDLNLLSPTLSDEEKQLLHKALSNENGG
jgi:hypothetical protein